ncbi:MAG: high-affinity nickel-transporter [Candidatus Rokuibacteriota bacterium]|nr:MAG: high-affinity nickel-transporter [Candidatus Rokubacteria bacterium]
MSCTRRPPPGRSSGSARPGGDREPGPVSARALSTAVGLAVLVGAAGAAAHPLGNFSINHYAALEIAPPVVYVRYIIDLAEIPTFQEIQETGVVADVGHPSAARYATDKAEALGRGLTLEVDGRRLALEQRAQEIVFPPGVGDLPTLKLGVLFRAQLPADAAGRELTLRYRDENFPGRAGWKEIIAVVRPGVTLVRSTVPSRDRSGGLASYPTDLLGSPPQDLEAQIVVLPAASAVAGFPSSEREPPIFGGGAGARRPTRDRFTELVGTPDASLGVVAIALLVASALGAFHALEPGHGKTVVAAYLVGSRGTARHALILGLIVTASHTAGVYLLGGITFYASRHVVPERLYPWLGLASGLTIAVLGFVLFVRRYSGGVDGHAHHHHGSDGHGHRHDPADHHHHDGTHHHHHEGEPVSLRSLFALGISGGIIPCPAALVVLLSAVSLRRVGFGLLLIVAFSVGLAAVLVTIGILMVYARRLMSRFHEDGPLVTRWLPMTSAAVITLLGLAIALQALATAGVLPPMTS